ncbi:MAG TPA: OsmC family protein [Verrucomicrobiae bacterium]|nr:OsmC family protein [Verrucomicrobiae bacterium]
MITAHALYTDRDRFLAEAASGHAIIVDAGTEKSANSPVELVLIALCACSASDVVSILRKKREPFTSVDVSAEGERSEEFPKVFTSIRVVYRIGGKVTPKAVEDAVRLSKEKYCSVSAMLEKSAKIDFVIEHID